jgi:excisionase family DNA binding protein
MEGKKMEERYHLISAASAAKRLNISRATLSRLVKSRQLGTYRVGHRTMFDVRIIEEYKSAVLHPARHDAGALSA